MKMSKKMVLTEYYELCEGGICRDLLTEEEKKQITEGKMILTGKLQAADQKNGNGRVYPEKILKREVKNYEKLIRERRSLGELDHPEDSVVNLKNASHLVRRIWWDGAAVMGTVEVLNTPSGKILQSLIESNIKLGISSRGLGSTKEVSGKTMVQDDFQLVCFDFVSEPSTTGAFMIKEGKLGENLTKADKIYRALNSILGEEE
tara:strand:- start:92 stop:703 length:612 start_codon:yes stop_codon:yes gene_type:complete